MKADRLLDAMNGIDDKTILDTVLTFENVGTGHKRRPIKIIILAAVIMILLTVTACALVLYSINYNSVDSADGMSGRWVDYNQAGNIENDWIVSFPNAKFCFSFNGPEDISKTYTFKANWLPSAPNYAHEIDIKNEIKLLPSGAYAMDDWDFYLCNSAEPAGDEYPYYITVQQASCNTNYILQGETEVLKDEQHGDWQLLELHVDYSKTMPGFAKNGVNYLYIYHIKEGTLINVAGTESVTVLEKIAKNLEIKETDKDHSSHPGKATSIREIVMADIGRG